MSITQRLLFVLFALAVTLCGRLLPHPANFTPVLAVSVLTGLCLPGRGFSLAAGLLTMLLGDLASWWMLNSNIPFSDYFLSLSALFVYLPVGIIVLSASFLRPSGAGMLVLSGFSAGLFFWVVSNFGTWLSGTLYPATAAGLATCYTAAIPFLQNQLAGDVFYTLFLLAAWNFASRRTLSLSTH